MKAALTLIALVAMVVPPSETPEQIAAELTRGRPAVARILARHPEFLEAWREPFWADALLRAPQLPGGPWRTHDLRRPQPPNARLSLANCPSQPPPRDAIILLDRASHGFTGPDVGLWERDGEALVASGRRGHRIKTAASFRSVRLHLEFRTPADMPRGAWQYRGNSGVYFGDRYEVQILDSWRNSVYPDGAMAALYGQRPPDSIASLPPGRWQCLDIVYRPPRFEAERVRSPARVSVRLNGVMVQRDAPFLGPTGFAELRPYEVHAPDQPIALQDHGDPTSRVAFRNVWARHLRDCTNDACQAEERYLR